jgi:nucleoid-associated protein EbfC
MAQLPEGVPEQLQALQAKLLEAQKELAAQTIQGSAGKGGVVVTITGDQKCVSVEITEDFYQTNNKKTLQEVTKAALNEALEASRKIAANRLSPYSPDLKK